MFVVFVTTVVLLFSQLGTAAEFLRRENDFQVLSLGSSGTWKIFTATPLPFSPLSAFFLVFVYIRTDATLGRICPKSYGSYQWIGCL